MKVAVVILCLLPLAYGALLGNIFDLDEMQKLVNAVVEKFGTKASEQECEKECVILSNSDIFDLGCDFACREIQSLIQKFHT